VKLSSLPGVLIQDVAKALDVHPFMLSLWRKQVREGVIVARASKLDVETTAELRRLRELDRSRGRLRRRLSFGRGVHVASGPRAAKSLPRPTRHSARRISRLICARSVRSGPTPCTLGSREQMRFIL
jgi:transposase